MFRKEKQPLKSLRVRHQITLGSIVFIKQGRNILSKLDNMLYTDLNRPRPGLIKVEGKTALMSVEKCCVLYIPN